MDEKNDCCELTVTIKADLAEGLQDVLSTAILDAVEIHLDRDDSAATGDLAISLDEFNTGRMYAYATLSITGNLNGQPLEKSFRRKSSLKRVTSFGIIGAVIAEAVTHYSAFDPGLGKLGESLDECLADAMLLIDKTLGRRDTALARRWKMISWARWIIAAIVFASYVLMPLLALDEELYMPGVLSVAGFLACCAFGVVHLFGLASMPDRFFLVEPRGKKALLRTGVRDINKMRLMVIFAGILAVVIFAVCAGVLFVNGNGDAQP